MTFQQEWINENKGGYREYIIIIHRSWTLLNSRERERDRGHKTMKLQSQKWQNTKFKKIRLNPAEKKKKGIEWMVIGVTECVLKQLIRYIKGGQNTNNMYIMSGDWVYLFNTKLIECQNFFKSD